MTDLQKAIAYKLLYWGGITLAVVGMRSTVPGDWLNLAYWGWLTVFAVGVLCIQGSYKFQGFGLIESIRKKVETT